MSPLLRPTYQEGQILGAADLNAQLEYERLGAVLHERTEHLWGVAQGLELDTEQQQLNDPAKTKYVDVILRPGRAVDRLGRSIVVTEPITLEPDAFAQQIANPNANTLYPVFVQAIEVPRPDTTRPGKCAVGLTTRIEESLQIAFGQPGEELAVLEQTAATVDQGFALPAGLFDKVLVGWVKFNDTVKKFDAVATEANGIRIRYVGVVASDVVAGGGELALHTRAGGTRFAVTLVENSTGGCLLRFGKQDGNQPLVPTFSVDENGNVTYAGTLTPAPVSKTLAESGIAFHGTILPLPAGVTESQVSQATVRLHVVLTPWPHAPAKRSLPTADALALPIVQTCAIDANRKVDCTVRWQGTTAETEYIVTPSACTYVVIASGK